MDFTLLKKKCGIGLTGGIATGKTTVANIIEEAGYHVIDADELARKAVVPGSSGLAKIVESFGAGVLDESGLLDRKSLSKIVFMQPEKKKRLENILHPYIHEILQKKLTEYAIDVSESIWFYDAALLFETGTFSDFRKIWCTYCSEETQLSRIMTRDKASVEWAKTILSNQMAAKTKADKAEVVIDTDKPIAEVKEQVLTALENI